MRDLTHQRCQNHMPREAVARCPECGRFFCRECITEHEDKVLCAACLRKLVGSPAKKSVGYQKLLQLGHFMLGILILYVIFYYVAGILLALPSDFHEGTLWQAGWWTRP
ncbi:MAG: rhomboid family protein [Deltaproteobacteria bacterium]|nr:rhomboid family protein [Deltaproteobacteria bacterium]